MQAIAKHMDGWKAIQSENSHCYLKKDGREISVTYDRYKGRLHFFGQMPESGPHHQRFYFSSYDKIAKENVNDITVACDRDPKAIAQDVTRRLLPGFTVRYEYAKESIARSEKERLEKNERIRLACRLTGENFRDDWLRADAYPEVGYHGGIRIKVGSDFEVKFSIKSSADLTKIVEYIQYTQKASADKAARVKAAVEAAAAKAEPSVKTIWNQRRHRRPGPDLHAAGKGEVMSNRIDAIIDILEEVECAAREVARGIDAESVRFVPGYEALCEALDALDVARSKEGVRVVSKKGGEAMKRIMAADDDVFIRSRPLFRVTAIFMDLDEANAYMEAHKDAALIAEYSPFLFIADKADKGVKP